MDALRIHRPAIRTQAGSGFTLIELLVVIAIISLLVSILVPSLQKAKALAVQTACAVKMRGMGMAIHMYASENNDTFPPYAYYETVGRLYWGDLLKPYVGDDNPNWGADGSPCGEAFFCPVMGPAMGPDGEPVYHPRTGSTKYMGFAYNNWFLGGHEGWEKETNWESSDFSALKKVADIHAPAEILCLTEAGIPATWLPGSPILSVNKIEVANWIHFRHLSGNSQDVPGEGTCNAFYVDGHVSSESPKTLKTGDTNFYGQLPYME